MAVREILLYPKDEELLRLISKPVEGVTKDVRRLIRDLKDTLLQRPGVGLSAPQIGVHKRVAIIRLGQTHDGEDEELSDPVALINPEILTTEGEIKDYDGCLSVPNFYGYTYRPEKIRLSTLNVEGKRYEMALSGLDARVALHEIDHLNGILFIDLIRSRDDLYIIVRDSKRKQNVLVPVDKAFDLSSGVDSWRTISKNNSLFG